MTVDLDQLTIGAAAALIAARELSVVELIEGVLGRLEDTEPVVHAYACVLADSARVSASRADRELRSGRARGPLHGIPFGVKDLFWTEDAPTEAGSRVLAGFRAPEDATAVRRLREAGAIMIGKQVTHEFALGQNVPPTRNPWNLEHYPGGSSAGAGVSVAVGSSLAALGTDAGGSVRKPAALNGVVGLKPTAGRVSRHGLVPPSGSLDAVGPIVRTVEDCALVLQALAGPDAGDASASAESVPDYLVGLEEGVAGMRLGLCDYFFGSELEPEIRSLVEAAIEVCEGLGAKLVPVAIPTLDHALPAGLTILAAEAASAHRHLLGTRRDAYEEGTRRALEFGALLPAAEVKVAERMRVRIRAEIDLAFRLARLDALLAPTLPRTSIPLAEMRGDRDLPSFNPYTMPASLTGLPALTVPCGFTSDGLPAGLQVIGGPFDEARVLRVGHAYQGATGWHRRRPRPEI
ncbi:MAG: amidase [Solirubrobacterales bacterium]